ncbi:hypothetical protein BPOR_0612g00050 [Botrytis porri]|uniref:Uncharacterized protein n=1 Tax=Botrytis porri TaxID=87229 RepID=A0A4Z1KE25_9HELO|nr:hypothetical protein BPOR_0612g00050 [Botrytis porri]
MKKNKEKKIIPPKIRIKIHPTPTPSPPTYSAAFSHSSLLTLASSISNAKARNETAESDRDPLLDAKFRGGDEDAGYQAEDGEDGGEEYGERFVVGLGREEWRGK